MFSLTKQERLVLLCLVLVILAGSFLHWAFRKNTAFRQFFSIADKK